MSQYTPLQESNAIAFELACKEYCQKLINYEAANYPTGLALASAPETMDKIMGYHRTRDMCFSFLVDHSQVTVGHCLEELDSAKIDNFFTTYDPIDLVNFFHKGNLIDNFVAENELNQPNAFTNDTTYQTAFDQFIAKL